MLKKKEEAIQSDSEVNELLLDIADGIIDQIKQQKDSLDPFENYIKKVRSKVHSNIKVFRERFVKGYCTLLEETSRLDLHVREKK